MHGLCECRHCRGGAWRSGSGRTTDRAEGRMARCPCPPTHRLPAAPALECALEYVRREPTLRALVATIRATHNAVGRFGTAAAERIGRNAIEPMQPKRPYFLTVHAALTRLLRQRRTSVRQLHRQPSRTTVGAVCKARARPHRPDWAAHLPHDETSTAARRWRRAASSLRVRMGMISACCGE